MSTLPSTTPRMGQYSQVDAVAEAAELVAFIERAEAMDPIPLLRRRSYELLELRPGQSVVDVGCGTGISVHELAGRGLDVVGLDASRKMIDLAASRFPGRDYRVAPAGELPIASASMDGYRAERLYQHLDDPGAALAEAKRVLRPYGRMVVVDIDADGWAVDSDDRATTRDLLRAFADTLKHPWMGRRLRGMFLDAGLVDVTVESFACIYTGYDDCVQVLRSIAAAGRSAGVVDDAGAAAWLAEQEARSARDRFYVQGPLNVVAGTYVG